MNYLHSDKQAFNDIVLAASQYSEIKPAIIEKDYFVTLLLKCIVEKNPNIIFKGGTSLSKCHKIINRFSEDIDLGLNSDHATEGMRKTLKKNIVEAINELNFSLDNNSEIRSRMDYNRYQISYPVSVSTGFIKPYIYSDCIAQFENSLKFNF